MGGLCTTKFVYMLVLNICGGTTIIASISFRFYIWLGFFDLSAKHCSEVQLSHSAVNIYL